MAVILSMAVIANAATAAVPAGPRLAVVTHDARRGSELITISPTGEMRRRLIVELDSKRPSWSGEGSLVALAARGEDWDGPVVAIAEEDGSNLRVYRRAFLNADQNPVISPDGRSVAFLRTKLVKVLPGRENYLFKSSIWPLDIETGKVKQLIRWIGTVLTPSSYSPDGSRLALTMFTRRGLQAVAVDLGNGRLSLLAREASEPVYSPDGSEVAFVRWRNWRANGIDDTDGTCLTRAFTDPDLTLYGAAWQPSPGREAGRIAC